MSKRKPMNAMERAVWEDAEGAYLRRNIWKDGEKAGAPYLAVG